jgi:DNA-directed RNA polymerase specialized sigma24 family protein
MGVALTYAAEAIDRYVPGTAGTQYDFRLYCNIKSRLMRYLNTQRRRDDHHHLSHEPVRLEDLAAPPAQTPPAVLRPGPGTHSDHWQWSCDPITELGQLCSWVADRADLDTSTARLIVLTRAGGVTVDEIAATEGRTVESVWKRRQRAERRVRASLTAA